jgi:hypothetical protein
MLTKKNLVVLLTACLGCLALPTSDACAVNFAAGAKSSPGYQFKLFPFYYAADIRTNKDGDPAVRDLGLKKYGAMIGNFYQVGDLQLNAIIPVGKVEIDKLSSNDGGLGDIQLRAGWYPPVEWASILSGLMVKMPTGNFDKNNKANFGDGQTDLVAELYIFKLMQPFSFDALLKYNIRFRNHDTDVTPGNEFSAEALVTYRLAERIRVGPAVNFLVGADNKKGGNMVADSGLMRLSAGGEIWFGRLDHAKISLAAYKDLVTRNTNEGVTVMSRIVFEF